MSQAETTTSKVAAVAGPAEQDFILSSLPPSAAQKRLALGMVLVMMAAFVVAGLLSRVQLRRIDPFTLGCGAAMFVNDSITSVLLFAQFSILRSRALLAISCGYLFTALMLIPWGLAFPGVFAPSGVVGGLQTTPTAYLLWHAGFSALSPMRC